MSRGFPVVGIGFEEFWWARIGRNMNALRFFSTSRDVKLASTSRVTLMGVFNMLQCVSLLSPIKHSLVSVLIHWNLGACTCRRVACTNLRYDGWNRYVRSVLLRERLTACFVNKNIEYPASQAWHVTCYCNQFHTSGTKFHEMLFYAFFSRRCTHVRQLEEKKSLKNSEEFLIASLIFFFFFFHESQDLWLGKKIWWALMMIARLKTDSL